MRAVLALLFIFFSVDLYAITMADAINMAGRQRMLSQRITQAYILQGIQPDSKKHATVFNRSHTEFKRNLETLKQFDEAKPIAEQLNKVGALWSNFNQIIQAPITKSNGQKLFIESNKLLSESHRYVVSLQNLANHSAAELVNISGRQRMLSQRIAKNYVAHYWGVGGDNTQELLSEDLADFEHTLNYLLDSPLNTDTINTKLIRTKGHFKYAVKGFDGELSSSGDRVIHVTIGTTDMMLHNMNIITGLYAQVMNDQSS